jgi:hemerythrin-like metal-binding protein
MLIDPDQIRRVAVPFMNEDHVEEARLVNATADRAEAHREGRVGADQVTAALEALYQHTREHFSREESAMREASFPALSFHQAEHEHVLGELGEAERHFRETGKVEELMAYLAALPDWFDRHIGSMDDASARYVSEWGG